jgi:hypothetical protein
MEMTLPVRLNELSKKMFLDIELYCLKMGHEVVQTDINEGHYVVCNKCKQLIAFLESQNG